MQHEQSKRNRQSNLSDSSKVSSAISLPAVPALQKRISKICEFDKEPSTHNDAKADLKPFQLQRQNKQNLTGMPDNLKSGIENISGYSLDDVKVHYNSNKPAQLQAFAYAQGSEIHIGPGQEKHLPHEAWHVVQQKQGRVRPTLQMKQGFAVNDEQGLEHEASVMGSKALQFGNEKHIAVNNVPIQRMSPVIQMVTPLVTGRLNVVGEDHNETAGRLAREQLYCKTYSGSSSYWTESSFRTRKYSLWSDFFEDKRPRADPFKDRFEHALLKADSTNFWHYNTPAPTQPDIDHIDNNRAALPNLIRNGTQRFSHDLVVMISNLENDTDGFELTPQAKLAHIALKGDVTALYDQAAVCIRLLSTIGSPIAGIITALDLMWANLRTLKTSYGALRTDPEVRLSRSNAMHTAAEARHAEAGVWKVGDRHREDMANDPNPKSYNLVDRAAFNADYNTWNPAP